MRIRCIKSPVERERIYKTKTKKSRKTINNNNNVLMAYNE